MATVGKNMSSALPITGIYAFLVVPGHGLLVTRLTGG